MAKTRLVKGKSKAASITSSPDYFVDVSLPVPPEARHLIEDPMLKLRYGAKSIALVTQAANSLVVSRRLNEGESISGGHTYVLTLGRQMKNRTSKQLQRDVQQIYEGWKRDLQSDVITIAMMAENKLLNLPTPYDETDEEDEGETQYDWLPADVKLPEPERDLTNPYERRLKQIIDFLAVAGYEFGKQVEDAINEGILAAIRGLGAETDDAGFQPGSTGSDVPDNPVSDDPEGGDNGGRGEAAVLGAVNG